MNIVIKSGGNARSAPTGQYITLLGGLFVIVLSVTVMALVALAADRDGAQQGERTAKASAAALEAPRPPVSDGRHLYYVVATTEQQDQVMSANARALDELAVAGLEPPRYTLAVLVANTPEQLKLAGHLGGPGTRSHGRQFIDLRGAPSTGLGAPVKPAEDTSPAVGAMPPLDHDPCHTPIYNKEVCH